jgi:hypothetical protein
VARAFKTLNENRDMLSEKSHIGDKPDQDRWLPSLAGDTGMTMTEFQFEFCVMRSMLRI